MASRYIVAQQQRLWASGSQLSGSIASTPTSASTPPPSFLAVEEAAAVRQAHGLDAVRTAKGIGKGQSRQEGGRPLGLC